MRSKIEITSESSEGVDNTRLHHAIINNEKDIAFLCISADEEVYRASESTLINKRSLGNTPLVLALKTGAIEIVEKILSHPAVDVDLVDNLGLTPLHWACMLRQNKLIALLLSKNAYLMPYIIKNSHDMTLWGGKSEYVKDDKISPFYLYHHNTPYVAMKRHSTFPLFKDSPTFRARDAEAYTDCSFHMKSLCTNLKWDKDSDGVPLHFLSLNDTPYTGKLFVRNFAKGLEHFCRYRDAIAIDWELAKKLCCTDNDYKVFESLSTSQSMASRTVALKRSSSQISAFIDISIFPKKSKQVQKITLENSVETKRLFKDIEKAGITKLPSGNIAQWPSPLFKRLTPTESRANTVYRP